MRILAQVWGLHQALLQQKRDYDAGFVQKQFEARPDGTEVG